VLGFFHYFFSCKSFFPEKKSLTSTDLMCIFLQVIHSPVCSGCYLVAQQGAIEKGKACAGYIQVSSLQVVLLVSPVLPFSVRTVKVIISALVLSSPLFYTLGPSPNSACFFLCALENIVEILSQDPLLLPVPLPLAS